jgi:hypothetical protein
VLDRSLELRQRPVDVAAHDRGGELLRQPAPDPRARDAELDAQLDPSGTVRAAPDAPAAALVDAHDRVPGEVALGLELDDLDQAADLGRADPHQHPVARAEAGPRPPDAFPAGHAGEEVEHPRGV